MVFLKVSKPIMQENVKCNLKWNKNTIFELKFDVGIFKLSNYEAF